MKRTLKSIFSFLLIATSTFFANAEESQNTFGQPDFNYPQTVIANADAQLKKAIADKDNEDIVLALLESSLAKSMISKDTLPEIVKTIESVNKNITAKSINATLNLLEADILNTYYRNNRYSLDRRGNNISTASTNMLEWNGNQFRSRITELLNTALSYQDELTATPITKYRKFIDINSVSISTYPTMYDFIAYRSIAIFNSWGISNNAWNPFVKASQTASDNDNVLHLYDELLKIHKAGSRAYIKALLNKMSYKETDTYQQLDSLYQQYKDSPDVAPIIMSLTQKKELNTKAKHAILNSYLEQYPNNDYSPQIKRRMLSLELPSTTVSYQNQYTSIDSIRLTCNVVNTNQFTVSIYSVPNSYYIRNNDFLKGKPIHTQDFTLNDTIPFSDTLMLSFPPLEYGRYTAIITTFDKNGEKAEQQNNLYSTFIVSDITSFSITNNSEESRRIFAQNAISGEPYKNVTVESTSGYKENKQSYQEKTNHLGYVTASDTKYQRFNFTKGNDSCYSASAHSYFFKPNYNTNQKTASIFTDLAIYRPGETIHLSAVCYQMKPNSNELSRKQAFKLFFLDSNNDTISSANVKTDEMGRFSHDFTVPTNRMNGEYTISVTDDKNNICNRKQITVSEYKVPTFYIEFTDTKRTYSDAGNITLNGIAKTFSDMPLSNIDIACTLESAVLFSGFNQISTFNTTTDENGKFTITINAKALKEKEQYPICTYRIKATGTDLAGDTQSGSTIFNLGSAIVMRWDYDDSKYFNIDANKEVKLPVSITANDLNAPASYQCTMKLQNVVNGNTETLAFASGKPINLSHLASGEYRASIWIDKDSTVQIKDKKIVIFRTTDKQSPVASALWTPYEELSCVPGNESEILFGCTFDNTHIYYVMNHKDGIVKEGWLKKSKGMHRLKFTTPHEANLIIQLYCVKDLIPFKYDIIVTPKKDEPKIELTIESFRDKITAGDTEKWSLHFTSDGNPIAGGALLAAMTDKAINNLKDNRWHFITSSMFINTLSSLASQNRILWGPNSNRFNWKSSLTDIINNLQKSPTIKAPTLELYNQQFFDNKVKYCSIRTRSIKGTGNSEVSASSYDSGTFNFRAIAETAMQEMAMAKSDMAVTTNTQEYGAGTALDEAIEQNLNDVQIRTAPEKTVIWQPTPTTDVDGNAYIEFVTPNVNTTWMLQAIGYTQDLHTASLMKEVVSSKPIMVKSNMPRFLRQGDKASLAATVQNASDDTQSCETLIEVINPINNEVYASRKLSSDIKAKGIEAVSIEYQVPDTVSAIGFKIRTSNGKYSDGEQVLVPVLQSISPVIESKPFYIEPNDSEYKVTLPKSNDEARITFEYCDNPVWYVATALPAIKSDGNTTATQIAHSIFANLTALKIVEEYPQIKDAISYWKTHQQDSALISMLEKNQDLKIGTLLASPWFNDSKRQTLRMQQLADLFDTQTAYASTDKLVKALGNLQLSDGGFSWFRYNGATSSVYTTMKVLQLLGKARTIGITNDNLEPIICDAVKFLDKAIIERYNRQTNKLSFSGYGDFAYTRSLFLDIPMSVTVKNLYDKITQSLTNEWKSMNIADKAFTSITLINFGKMSQAKPIINSIMQFGIKNPATGMYWDNYQNSWNSYCGKVTLTSLMLQALSKTTPQSANIDMIRKWLLLEKQTNDWGNSSLAADAVYALLATGTKWLNTNSQPSITLNGEELQFNPIDKILGYGKIQLSTASGATDNVITIKRKGGNPAWGAIYSQYNAPMTEIKAASVPQLSISKEIVNYNTEATELKVGDKVQVRLTIKNTQNLEYVTVTDERAACLEPSDKVSGYRYAEGVGYYVEIKDSATNLFFNSLPKGTYVIIYDTYVTNPGIFHSGIATAQCQYAPQVTAHSAGEVIQVAE